MQPYGITPAFYRETAVRRASSWGLILLLPPLLSVIHASSKAVSRITSVSGSKDPLPVQACSLPTVEVARNNVFGVSSHEGVEFLQLTPFGTKLHRGPRGELLDPSSNQAQDLLLRSIAGCNEKGSDLNVHDLST
jgi:hypothetical protein